MGLDIWFRDDVIRKLRAAEHGQAVMSKFFLADGMKEQHAYNRGFYDALVVVAVAFGVEEELAKKVVLTERY